ncbi:MAG: hypothetical protein V4676_00285 [Bacteroidota bacterium]
MHRLAFIATAFFVSACGNNTAQNTEEAGFNFETFSKKFESRQLPYTVSDSGLLKPSDTVAIREPMFAEFISDSMKRKVFAANAKIKYTPLGKLTSKEEIYFVVKAASGNKRAAYLLVFNKANEFTASFPFLLPDVNTSTTQVSSIDKSFSVNRSTIRRQTNDVNLEGREVYAYVPDLKQFALIMTDMPDDSKAELINPIDTLPKTHKYAGDYVKGSRNIISIRNGRSSNQLLAFVHLEKENTECIGELKGELFFTSSTTAVYRQGGDPCVLQFLFTTNGVSLKEEEGCGNHRGLDCAFAGTYPRKKVAKTKLSKKAKRK